jgi:hypothetical protein
MLLPDITPGFQTANQTMIHASLKGLKKESMIILPARIKFLTIQH